MRNAVMLSGAKNDKTPHRVPSAVVLILRFANSILQPPGVGGWRLCTRHATLSRPHHLPQNLW